PPPPAPGAPLCTDAAPFSLRNETRGAEPIEPGVARDRERLRQRQARVDAGLDVVEDVVADGVTARAGERRGGPEQPWGQRGLGDDRLEGRACRIHALGRAVDE